MSPKSMHVGPTTNRIENQTIPEESEEAFAKSISGGPSSNTDSEQDPEDVSSDEGEYENLPVLVDGSEGADLAGQQPNAEQGPSGDEE